MKYEKVYLDSYGYEDAPHKITTKSMEEKLGAEIMDAYNNRGGAVSIKENKRKMAESNKAFAHYRW